MQQWRVARRAGAGAGHAVEPAASQPNGRCPAPGRRARHGSGTCGRPARVANKSSKRAGAGSKEVACKGELLKKGRRYDMHIKRAPYPP